MIGHVNKIIVVLFTTKNQGCVFKGGCNDLKSLVLKQYITRCIRTQEGPERDRNCRAIYNESYVDQ
jgi:hypothetical protein